MGCNYSSMLKFSGCLIKPPIKLVHGLAWLANTSYYIRTVVAFFIFPIYQNNKNTGYLYRISRSYMTGVTTAELWRHLTNMNIIENCDIWAKSQCLVTEKRSYPHLRKYQLMILILQLVNRQSINWIAILRPGQSKMLIIWLYHQPDARVQVKWLDSTLHLLTIYLGRLQHSVLV